MKKMDDERQRQILRILKSALDLDLSERRSYLEKACNGDEMLQREVESILAANDQESDFLEAGAIEDAARMLAEEKAAQDTLILKSQPAGQPNDTPLRIAPGVILDGRYRIVRELGSGGIGVVFLAQDQKLHGKQVVIKVLQERLGESDQREWFEKKFRDEIKALEQIDHPNVVSALDVGLLPDGRSFLVMQHVSGTTLRAAIPTQGMELSRVGKLVHQIAQGLSAAHGKGVIHRDLKPENIMLTESGDEEHIKLIDFGMATVREAISEATSETTKVAGTIRYMAPEQLEGHPVLASDIYALGVITYELITGRQPFEADSAVQLYKKQQAGALIKPGELRANLPAGVQDVVLKSLSFNASDRYASAREFSEAFNSFLYNGKDQKDGFVANTRRYNTNVDKPEQLEPVRILPDISVSTHSAIRPRLWLLATMLLILLLGVAVVWWRNGGVKVTPPNVSHPTSSPSIVPEPSLTYSILLQKGIRAHPPSFTSGNHPFRVGDGVRFHVRSGQAGHFYIINKGPKRKSESPYNLLFPNINANLGSSAIAASQPLQIPSLGSQSDWLYFHQKGIEVIWLIWSEQVIPELENVKGADGEKSEEIRDPSQIEFLDKLLVVKAASETRVKPDEANKMTTITGKGAVLIWPVKLEVR
jgi:serine/threonine protein kinase